MFLVGKPTEYSMSPEVMGECPPDVIMDAAEVWVSMNSQSTTSRLAE